MAAQRPVIFSTLKTLLQSGVPAVSNRVYLPWDDQPELVAGSPIIEIATGESTIQQIGMSFSDHIVSVFIGVVKTGKFDYQTTYDILSAASKTISDNHTLSGKAKSIEIDGVQDHRIEAGERILWPHISARITYRTPAGEL